MQTKKRPSPGPKPTRRRGKRVSRSNARPGSKLTVFLPDIHLGKEQDAVALDCALRVVEHYKPDEVVIGGDMLDCGLFSSHPARSIEDAMHEDFFRTEVDPANRVLDRIQAVTDHLVFIEGNHEARIARKCADSSILKHLWDRIKPEALIGFDGKRGGTTFVPYDKPLPHYAISKRLIAFHGWSISRNFAEAHSRMLGYSISSVCGHVHRSQTFKTRNPITGEVIVSWSPGTLCTLQPAYVHHSPTSWTQGLSLIYVSKSSGRFQKIDITIEDGECVLPDGTKIQGRKTYKP